MHRIGKDGPSVSCWPFTAAVVTAAATVTVVVGDTHDQEGGGAASSRIVQKQHVSPGPSNGPWPFGVPNRQRRS
jgi:hypothetical protein